MLVLEGKEQRPQQPVAFIWGGWALDGFHKRYAHSSRNGCKPAWLYAEAWPAGAGSLSRGSAKSAVLQHRRPQGKRSGGRLRLPPFSQETPPRCTPNTSPVVIIEEIKLANFQLISTPF